MLKEQYCINGLTYPNLMDFFEFTRQQRIGFLMVRQVKRGRGYGKNYWGYRKTVNMFTKKHNNPISWLEQHPMKFNFLIKGDITSMTLMHIKYGGMISKGYDL